MNNRIKDILKRPQLLFLTFGHREWFNWMSDELYLKIAYRARMRLKLNLEKPQRYNEKLQWLKLYNRRPEYTMMVDKYEVKKYVANIIGQEFIIPTLGVWDSFDDIDFSKLPEKFVLKCTHDSGGLIVCKNKETLDISAARTKINRCLKHSFFWGMREWPYKDVKPRVIAEQYMEDKQTGELRDYKFFCFGGEVKALFIATERMKGEETKFDFFDEQFNHLPFTNGHPNAEMMPQKPLRFEDMKILAEKLSKDIPHVRIDFYEVDGKVYFGEMTFFHWSGFTPFVPDTWDYKFGSWITLPQKKI